MQKSWLKLPIVAVLIIVVFIAVIFKFFIDARAKNKPLSITTTPAEAREELSNAPIITLPPEPEKQKPAEITLKTEPLITTINLQVPYVPEAPDGLMVKPWNNSCEEASTAMLDEYYFGNKDKGITKAKAKKSILYYIDIENKLFGYNSNTNAAEMTKVINEYSKYFEAKVKTDPALEDIKNELRAGRPVIPLLYGKNLNNPRIQFARSGSYYHVFVIKGFDDKTKEFIVNDNGDLKQGLDLRYSYDTIMGALRDYDHKTKKTVKPATALFTSQRMLVKTADSGRIYLIKDNKKYHISSPVVFKDRKWKWGLVMMVEKSWLDKFQAGPTI